MYCACVRGGCVLAQRGEVDQNKMKVVARGSGSESQWLGDLMEWLVRVDLEADDHLFTRNLAKKQGGKVNKKRLTAAMIRQAVKNMAVKAGLPTGRFSAHSRRKGGRAE